MITRVLLVLATLIAPVFGVSAQTPPDLSGEWTSVPQRDLSVARLVAGPGAAHGWQTTIDGLLKQADYRVKLQQSSTGITVEFPGGRNNLLTAPAYTFADTVRVAVENHGEWWLRCQQRAEWKNGQLELETINSTGWWKTASPDAVRPTVTDFRERLTLVSDSSGNSMLLRAMLHDEKGEVEYVQRFRRVTPQP